MQDLAPRVFVSSVVEGFEEFRRAAKQAIQEAGAIPVLVNEDLPSLSTSSRNACFNAVDSSDIFALIIGQHGGWRTPSGRLVVEEEFERARKRKLPILVFIKNGDRDRDADQLARSVSDYIRGYFRTTFSTANELGDAMRGALDHAIGVSSRPMTDSFELQKLVNAPLTFGNEACIRIVLAPERNEEVFDALDLGSAELLNRVYGIAHGPSVQLLNYQHPKQPEVSSNAVLIHQESPHGRSGLQEVVLEIRGSGLIIIDSNITGRVRTVGSHDIGAMFVIAEEDLESALMASFRFCAELYESFDPYRRHEGFLYNACLSGIGYRQLERNPQPRSSFSMRTNSGSTVAVYDGPAAARSSIASESRRGGQTCGCFVGPEVGFSLGSQSRVYYRSPNPASISM